MCVYVCGYSGDCGAAMSWWFYLIPQGSSSGTLTYILMYTPQRIYIYTNTRTHTRYLLSYFHSDFYPSIFSQPLKARGGSASPFVFPVHVCILRALHLLLLPSRFHLFSMLLILFVPTSLAPPPFLTFTPFTSVKTVFSPGFQLDRWRKCKSMSKYVFVPPHTKFDVDFYGPYLFLITSLSFIHALETCLKSNITQSHRRTFSSKQ